MLVRPICIDLQIGYLYSNQIWIRLGIAIWIWIWMRITNSNWLSSQIG